MHLTRNCHFQIDEKISKLSYLKMCTHFHKKTIFFIFPMLILSFQISHEGFREYYNVVLVGAKTSSCKLALPAKINFNKKIISQSSVLGACKNNIWVWQSTCTTKGIQLVNIFQQCIMSCKTSANNWGQKNYFCFLICRWQKQIFTWAFTIFLINLIEFFK